MFHRRSWLCSVLLSTAFLCFGDEVPPEPIQADNWCCTFSEARRLALKRAGPIPSGKIPHLHLSAHSKRLASIGRKSLRRGRKRKTVSKTKSSRSRSLPSVAENRHRAKGFLAKARRAKENGQLELALRFSKLAQTMEPESPEARQQVDEIQREME